MPYHVTFGDKQKVLHVGKNSLLEAIAEAFMINTSNLSQFTYKQWDDERIDWVDVEFANIPENAS